MARGINMDKKTITHALRMLEFSTAAKNPHTHPGTQHTADPHTIGPLSPSRVVPHGPRCVLLNVHVIKYLSKTVLQTS